MFVLDAGYDPIGISHDLATERCEVVCRIRDDRVFYTDTPARANRPPETGGRPPRHGRRWKCSDPETWPEPDANLVASDPRYGRLTVTAWHDMHPRLSGHGHWAGFRTTADRPRHGDPRRGRASPETDLSREEDAVAVVVGQRQA